MCLVFIPGFWQKSAKNPCNDLSDRNRKLISVIHNKPLSTTPEWVLTGWLSGLLDSFRTGAGRQRVQAGDWRVRTFRPSPLTSEVGSGAADRINHQYSMTWSIRPSNKTAIKTLNWGVQNASELVKASMWQEGRHIPNSKRTDAPTYGTLLDLALLYPSLSGHLFVTYNL